MALGTIKVKDLVEQAFLGRLDIPEFQRSFVWNPQQVRNLADSLYKQYPVGPILVWEKPEYTSPKYETDKSFQDKSWIVAIDPRLFRHSVPQYTILDLGLCIGNNRTGYPL